MTSGSLGAEPVAAAPGVALGRADRSTRNAFSTFVVALILGVVFYIVKGRRLWFFGVFGDEWDFLAGRRLNVGDLLQPHGDHLVALPAFVFRLLFTVFGLRTYMPYQLVAIGLHVCAAALLRVVIRRAGVNPWIATAAATLFVFFGAGSENILIAFQITFTGALVLGLCQLLLADHDGPLDRRDAAGVVAGLGSLLCSDVSLVMIGSVGVAALMARRWRAAAVHVLPLATIFLAWSVGYARGTHATVDRAHIANGLHTVTATFQALGQLRYVGWALAAMLLVGMTLAWRDTPPAERQPRFGVPVALLAGALSFVSIIAANRGGLGEQFLASSRYLYVVAAMLLPALAVSGDAIVRRRRALGPIVLALLLVAIPGNIAKTGGVVHRRSFDERVLTSLPRMPLARGVPRSLHPTQSFAAEVTVGWLLDGVKSGRIPATSAPTPVEFANNTLRLSLEQSGGPLRTSCKPFGPEIVRHLVKGESLRVRGTVGVQLVGNATRMTSQELPFGGSLVAIAPAFVLRDVGGPLNLRIKPLSFGAAIC